LVEPKGGGAQKRKSGTKRGMEKKKTRGRVKKKTCK